MRAAIVLGAVVVSVGGLGACERAPTDGATPPGAPAAAPMPRPTDASVGNQRPAGLDAACGDDAGMLAGPRVSAGDDRIRVVNKYCPLLVGQSVGADKLCPRDLTRTLDGQSVGFCDKACVEAWDQMSDQRRREILRETLALEPAPMP